jgi:hypothetical protein
VTESNRGLRRSGRDMVAHGSKGDGSQFVSGADRVAGSGVGGCGGVGCSCFAVSVWLIIGRRS